ncbi:MAG: thiamine-phosphate kinase [Halioglobus sp.]|nr:thiamine-phosphate kinase [Halioglobus sp.]
MPLSEFALIYRYFSSLGHGESVDLSVGDDCAILRLQPAERLATSVDTLVAGVHFAADDFPEDIGFRCVSVAASDLAAMGARPVGMTVALTLPEAQEFWLHSFSEGLAAAVGEYGLPLVGGDTTRGPLSISVQVLGALPQDQALLRGGARPGDAVYVSGTLGDAAAALAFLQGEWQPQPQQGEYLLGRLHRPRARLALGRDLLGSASAAIDVSDGLLADAGHIAAASGVCIEIDAQSLPLSSALAAFPDRERALAWAATGGDDYELCYCLPPGEDARGGTRIGQVRPGEGVTCALALDGAPGYDHFGAGDAAS